MTEHQPHPDSTVVFDVPGRFYAQGAEELLSITRAATMDGTEPVYAPVREFIEQHGLVLTDQKRTTISGVLVDHFIYETPQRRDGQYAAGRQGEHLAGVEDM